MKCIFFLLFPFLWVLQLYGQQIYKLDAGTVYEPRLLSGHLKMGHPGPEGKEILINNRYMTIGGKPVIPVMGEMHYSRYPKEQWEDAILKMKANGINIIATYVIWIHHEEIEGQFDWSGNKDLRSFLELVHKHGLYAYPRIGPWVHGEVRNGGTPDWILKKEYLADRSNDPVYQEYAGRYYGQVAKQLRGLLYKDGGPVIGIQLENEYRRGEGGIPHILWLKETARKHGIDVPMYTITGWGNVSLPQDEVIPLFGGYPEEPWVTNLKPLKENSSFEFEYSRNNAGIGNEAGNQGEQELENISRYPYFTCEIGVGNQISEHRRPIIDPIDGLTIATAKVGSGSNLPGYYVFTGGSNPPGVLTTMEENQDETAYWNEYPDISYDFQAAIRETGELAPSYHQVKKLHYFLKEFGTALAPMQAVIAPKRNPKEDLQYALRVKDDAGFLFGVNYYRGVRKPTHQNARFRLKLKEETLEFPSGKISIPDSSVFIWPVNFNMKGALLKWATVQPLARIEQPGRTDWFFFRNDGIEAEVSFDAATVENLEAGSGKIREKNGRFIISDIKAGVNNFISFTNKKGEPQRLIILTGEEAEKVWLLEEGEKEHLIISDADLYLNQGELHIFGTSGKMNLRVLSETSDLGVSEFMTGVQEDGPYPQFSVTVPEKEVNIKPRALMPLERAQWLKLSVEKISDKTVLYDKLFIKEFNAGNPSAIKSAKLLLATEAAGKVQINGRWLNQQVEKGTLNRLDITGYVEKGENRILLDFPFQTEDAAFAARLEVEYYNADKVEWYTDQSWLTAEQYMPPSGLKKAGGYKAPEITTSRQIAGLEETAEWVLPVPRDYARGLNQLYLHIDYLGDKAQCRSGHQLVYDNFNNGTPWRMELKRFGNQLEGQELRIKLFPLEKDAKIAFDPGVMPGKGEKVQIQELKVVPEYKVVTSIK